MHIMNNGLKLITFKIKTTAPKSYSVSSKFDFIKSKSKVSILGKIILCRRIVHRYEF